MANFTVMTTFGMVATETSPPVPIISYEVLDAVNIYGNILLRGSLTLFGVINNIINMIIFKRLGIKDSMSVGLWSLSFSDFLVSLLGFAGSVFYLWKLFLPDYGINPLAIGSVSSGWWRDIFLLSSAWITTYLSVERCVCVVFPFKVKHLFNKKRSIICMVVIFTVNIAVHIPVIATQWLGWKTVEVQIGNETVTRERMIVMTSDNRKQIQFYIDIANGAVLPYPSQILVLISVVWMIYGLRASSRIRSTKVGKEKEEEGTENESKLSDKERRLVKAVLFLAIILTVCNIPRFIAVYAKQIFPEIAVGRSYRNLYTLLWSIAAMAGIINSSINIFVYMSINTSFRKEFERLLFCFKKEH